MDNYKTLAEEFAQSCENICWFPLDVFRLEDIEKLVEFCGLQCHELTPQVVCEIQLLEDSLQSRLADTLTGEED